MPESSTPTSTPMARLWVKTTNDRRQHHHRRGARMGARLLIEDQEKVPIETMIMIATSAAIGI
jgi:hypothetical protein